MKPQADNYRLAQSASALGAGLLGFGIGAIWGMAINRAILLIVLTVGGVIHVAGMYVMQIKEQRRAGIIARLLWISAWVCLLILVILFIYLAMG